MRGSDLRKHPDNVSRPAAITSWRLIRATKDQTAVMMLIAMVAMLVVFPPEATRAQDAGAGEIAFKKCLPCHAVGHGARNKFGPQLNGLDGRMSGTAGGYKYSAAYKTARIVWNETTFVEYIKDPKWLIPGVKMGFRGVGSDAEAMNLWAYLSQFNADGTKD